MLETRPNDESAKCWALTTPQQPLWGSSLSLSICVAMWHWMTQENTSYCARGSPLDTHSMPMGRMTRGREREHYYLYSLHTQILVSLSRHVAKYAIPFLQVNSIIFCPFLQAKYVFIPVCFSICNYFVSATVLCLYYWNVWIYLAAILTVI